jgi:predicted acylesterase/phospholipase RssA
MTEPVVHTAIALQGGGALGAYEYGVLKALYEQRPGFRPVAVSGISIGAVTAAVVGGAKDHPMDALERLWRDRLTVEAPFPVRLFVPRAVDQQLAAFGNPGMYGPPGTFTSLYNTRRLRRTLTDLTDPVKLNDPDLRVIVGAVNVTTGEMTYFDRDRPGGLTLEHVAASGALPPGFPAVTIDGQSYWDGGLFSNTPLAPAINALEDAGDGARDAVRELIVVELFPMDAPRPRTLPDVIHRTMQLQYASRLRLDEAFFSKFDRVVDLMDALDAELAPDSPIRDAPEFRELRGYRKINRFNVVTATLPRRLANAADFSRASIEARIRAGYEDATVQGIGDVDSPNLRPGVPTAV